MKKSNQTPGHGNENKLLPTENATQIVFGLLKCGHFLQRGMNQICQRYGLKQQQFSVLNEIVWHGPLTQKELCESLLFEKSNVSKIVKLLFEREWIRVVVATTWRASVLASRGVIRRHSRLPLIFAAVFRSGSFPGGSRPRILWAL